MHRSEFKRGIFSVILPEHGSSRRAGLTLIELLVVIAVIGVVALVLLLSVQFQISRSRDARRKTDLERIRVAFEDYYNDHNCYPPPEILNDCGGAQLQPYIDKIPCDPETGDPYLYVPLGGNTCGGYRVLTRLSDSSDPAIAQLRCDGVCGCGFIGYNYGVSAGIPVWDSQCLVPPNLPEPTTSPTATPTTPPDPDGTPDPTEEPSPEGTPPPIIYVYACDASSVCNQYEEGHPFLVNCPTTFPTIPDCTVGCQNPANRCN